MWPPMREGPRGRNWKIAGSSRLRYAAALCGGSVWPVWWVDKEASDEAKEAIGRTITQLTSYRSEQLASALVEVFDKLYTHPLLHWRAFGRSVAFTIAVSLIVIFETTTDAWHVRVPVVLYIFSFNVITDYTALFLIRPILIRFGARPALALMVGAASGAAVVAVANVIRFAAGIALSAYFHFAGDTDSSFQLRQVFDVEALEVAAIMSVAYLPASPFVWAALAAFWWLPLFWGQHTCRADACAAVVATRTGSMVSKGWQSTPL
jgi:hypothetical protein